MNSFYYFDKNTYLINFGFLWLISSIPKSFDTLSNWNLLNPSEKCILDSLSLKIEKYFSLKDPEEISFLNLYPSLKKGSNIFNNFCSR